MITYNELRNALKEGILTDNEFIDMMFFLLKQRTAVIESLEGESL